MADPSTLDPQIPNTPKLNAGITQFDSKGVTIYNDIRDTKIQQFCGKDFTDNVQAEMISGAIEISRVVHHTKTLVKDGITYEDLIANLLLEGEVINPNVPIIEYGKVTVNTTIKKEAPPTSTTGATMTNYSCFPNLSDYTNGNNKKHVETYYRGRAYLTNKRLILLSSNTEQITTAKNSIFFGLSVVRTDYDGISYRHFPIESLQGAQLSSFIGANGEMTIEPEYNYGCGLCCVSCCMPVFVNCCLNHYKSKIIKTGSTNSKEITLGFQTHDQWPFWGEHHGSITLHLISHYPVSEASRFIGFLQGNPNMNHIKPKITEISSAKYYSPSTGVTDGQVVYTNLNSNSKIVQSQVYQPIQEMKTLPSSDVAMTTSIPMTMPMPTPAAAAAAVPEPFSYPDVSAFNVNTSTVTTNVNTTTVDGSTMTQNQNGIESATSPQNNNEYVPFATTPTV